MRFYSPRYRPAPPPAAPPLTSALRLARAERRALEREIVGTAEAIYPKDGFAAVATAEREEGWVIEVLLGDHHLRLTGLRSEKLALIAARNVLRDRLRSVKR